MHRICRRHATWTEARCRFKLVISASLIVSAFRRLLHLQNRGFEQQSTSAKANLGHGRCRERKHLSSSRLELPSIHLIVKAVPGSHNKRHFAGAGQAGPEVGVRHPFLPEHAAAAGEERLRPDVGRHPAARHRTEGRERPGLCRVAGSPLVQGAALVITIGAPMAPNEARWFLGEPISLIFFAGPLIGWLPSSWHFSSPLHATHPVYLHGIVRALAALAPAARVYSWESEGIEASKLNPQSL